MAAAVLDAAVLRCDAAVERIDHAGGHAVAQDLRQMGDIGRQFTAEQHIHDAAVHAPPVVDGTAIGAGLIPHPAAVEDGADDIFIELAPVPERGGEILQHAAGPDQEGAELPLGAVGCRRIAARDDGDPLLREGMQRVGLVGQAGPQQLDPGAGVCHACPQRKGIDVGGHAVAGIVRHIADAVPRCHGTGDGTCDELGLVHAGVVGADARVGHLH